MVKLDGSQVITLVALTLTGAVVLYVLYRMFNMKEQPQASLSYNQPIYAPPQQMILPDVIQVTNADRPHGVSRQQRYIVTDMETIVGHDEPLNWYSCEIYNEGPGNLYYSINKRRQSESPLSPGQSINIPMNMRDSIKKIFLKSDSTATVYLNAIK